MGRVWWGSTRQVTVKSHYLNSSLIHADIMQQVPLSVTPEDFDDGGGRRKTRS